MASDAKPDSPPAGVDPPPPKEEAKAEKEGEGEEPQSGGRKRGRRKKGEAEKEKEKPPPATPTIERPSRERKTVERYSELAPRVTPAKKSPAILQVTSPCPDLFSRGMALPRFCCFCPAQSWNLFSFFFSCPSTTSAKNSRF